MGAAVAQKVAARFQRSMGESGGGKSTFCRACCCGDDDDDDDDDDAGVVTKASVALFGIAVVLVVAADNVHDPFGDLQS
jgi:hypothetical protein